jgi:cytochrome oxidase Cu insertion factor (SCO1/SenC/PrrC family)
VPAAPEIRKAAEATLPPGRYSGIQLGDASLPADIVVSPGLVEPVLLGVSHGEAVPGGVWAGNDAVNLGLSELAGKLTPIADFHLVDQSGRPFDRAAIAGRDVVLAAFHTTCQETCPLYTGLFLQLSRQLPPGVTLAEVTTDPEVDTPAVLQDYARRVGADWTFATGEPGELAGFWSQFGVALSQGDQHVSTLALVDRHGYVRLVYRGVPDVNGSLPAPLLDQLSEEGRKELAGGGEGWGAPQVLDALRTIGAVAQPQTQGGGEAPQFTARGLDGREVSLASLRGRPVVINFFASWCPPCRSELPNLEESAAKHPDATFLLVDVRDDPGQARKLLADLGVRHAVALSDPDGAISSLYSVPALPTTVFVRADGTIEARYPRQLDEGTLASHMAALSGR